MAFSCAGFCACCLGAIAQTPNPSPTSQPSVTTLTVTTRQVLLDVLVTDASGRPVTGLKASDFTLTEEGTPQTIRNLQEHHPMSAADVEKLISVPALPPNTFTNYKPVLNTNASTVILLDALNTPLSAQMYLREQVIAYVKNMQPGASIAVFQLDTQMHLIQGFSSDQQALLAAVSSKRDMPSLQQPIHGSNSEYRRLRREILREGLQIMGRYLAGFPGRKNLIWFTGDVPLSKFGTLLGNPFKDSFSVRRNSDNDLNDMADVLTLSRVAVYPIDTRGLEAGVQFDRRRNFDHLDLDEVAASTGGKAYYNTNGLKDVIAEIVDRGSNYYTLAYTTTNREWNGQLRHIKVTVNRPGLILQHRGGYFAHNRGAAEQRQIAALQQRREQAANQPPARPAADNKPPTAAEPEAAPLPSDAAADDTGALVHHSSKTGFAGSMALGAVPPTEIVFKASFAVDDKVTRLDKNAPPPNTYLSPPYQDKPFRTYTILVRTDAHRIKVTQTPDGMRHGTVEFVTIVYDPTGAAVNSLLSTASLDLTEDKYRQMLQSDLPVRTQIAVPAKGNFFLRLGVHDVEGDQIGALEIAVDQIKLGVVGQGLQTP